MSIAGVSETDFQLFKSLLNTDSVELSRDNIDTKLHSAERVLSKSAVDAPQGQPSDDDVEDQEESEDEPEEQPEAVASPSLFRQRMAEIEEDRMSQASTPVSQVSVPNFRPRRVKEPRHRQRPEQGANGQVPLKKLFAETQYIPEDFTHIDVDEENNDPTMRREKQEILFQLLKTYPTESKGQWSMKVPLFELKYELLRRERFRQEQDQLLFMQEMMKMILKGIEIANKKFGPFLELDGWAESVTRDMSRYDRCMKTLYHRYFKRKQMNPIVELLWLIVGSAAMWHCQAKFLGKRPQPQPAQGQPQQPPTENSTMFNNIHDIRPPSGGPKYPFANPGAAQQRSGINLGSIMKLFAQ